METVRLLLAGIGGYGQKYLQEWVDMDDPSVVIEGICEVMPGIEERFPVIKERNIPVYSSVEAFYEEHQADLEKLTISLS